MSQLEPLPRASRSALRRSDAELAVDVALGIVGGTVGVGLAVLRTTARVPALAAGWRPALVPARLQPARLVMGVARLGAQHRVRATALVDGLLDHWTPVIVEMVVSRLDLTGLVTRHVDIDDIVSGVDLDAAVARVDLDAAVARVDLDAVVGLVDLDAAVNGVDIDAIAARIDLDAVIDRIDMIAIVEEVLATIDLPAIIRESSGSMASETVRGARMTGISVDDAISRSLERHLFRRRRPPTPPTPVTPAEEAP